MTTPNVPLRNDVIAAKLVAIMASITDPTTSIRAAVEAELDLHYRNRRARSSARNGNGSARTGDRETSVLAASKVKVAPQKHAILRILARANGPLTASEISTRSGVKLGSVSTRMKELVTDLKFVREAGKVGYAGSLKLAYEITEAGRSWLSIGFASVAEPVDTVDVNCTPAIITRSRHLLDGAVHA